jgi:phosphotransferase system HPr-like phosphotransfer protein
MVSERIYSTQVTFKGSGRERLREIARFVLAATYYTCEVHVLHQGSKVDGKNILALADLPLTEEESLRVEASGPEARECLEALDQAAYLPNEPPLERTP